MIDRKIRCGPTRPDQKAAEDDLRFVRTSKSREQMMSCLADFQASASDMPEVQRDGGLPASSNGAAPDKVSATPTRPDQKAAEDDLRLVRTSKSKEQVMSCLADLEASASDMPEVKRDDGLPASFNGAAPDQVSATPTTFREWYHAHASTRLLEWLGAWPDEEVDAFIASLKLYVSSVRGAMSVDQVQHVQRTLGEDFFIGVQGRALQDFNDKGKDLGKHPITAQQLENIIRRSPVEKLDTLMLLMSP